MRAWHDAFDFCDRDDREEATEQREHREEQSETSDQHQKVSPSRMEICPARWVEVATKRRNRDHKTLEPHTDCLLYTSPSPRDATLSRMPSSA